MKSLKEEICDDIGITLRNMDYLLTGKRNSTLRTAVKIAQVVGTRPAIWMKGHNKGRRVKAMAAELKRRVDETPTYLIGEMYPETEEDQGNFLDWSDDKERFHIGRDGAYAKQVKCKKCGSVDFHVAQAGWYTAIRCTRCLWEMGLHEG